MTDQTPADIARFHACLPFTLRQECPLPDDWSNPRNFSNNAHDPGGATMCGIIQREYDSYRKRHGEPVRSVKLLTRDEGEDIYGAEYWMPYCPTLPAGLDLCFFDASVNEGSHEAVKILQHALGIEDDGAWGSHTELAIKGIGNVVATINGFTARREVVYREMPGYRYFGTDWERRARTIGTEALTMARPASAASAAAPASPAPAPQAESLLRRAEDVIKREI